MKSNDALLSHFVKAEETALGQRAKYLTDQVLVNPTQIDVHPNEVVFLHFLHNYNTNTPEGFELEVTTPTRVLRLNLLNTIEGSSNTILRSKGNIKFRTSILLDFYVQILRVQF